MGQRLVIYIKKGDEVIGNCYYHWDAYTRSAMSDVYDIIKNYNERLSSCELEDDIFVLRCFTLSDKDGVSAGKSAGLGDDSWKNMKKNYPHLDDWALPKAMDRNEGIIATVQSEMDNNTDSEEGYLLIDFDEKMIEFEVLSNYGSEEQWKEEVGEYEEDLDVKNLLVAPCNIFSFSFLDIEDVISFLDKVTENGYYFINNDGGVTNVCGMIE